MGIRAWKGDITTLDVDCIVNAANTSLLGGSGVDGAIHRAAGPELALAGRMLGGCRPGQAKLTPGFRLPARFVIHTVGPVWQGGASGEAEVLRQCYQNSIALALAEGFGSIAFPAISTGIYGFPKDLAAEIAVAELSPFAPQLEIVLVAFDQETFELYRRLTG